MWRVYLLRGYALAVGMGLFGLGLVGLSPLPPNMITPENIMHLGVGLLYVCGVWLIGAAFDLLRAFVGGMGLLLVLGKGVIIAARWADLSFLHLPAVGVVCLLAGLTALILALFVGIGAPSRD